MAARGSHTVIVLNRCSNISFSMLPGLIYAHAVDELGIEDKNETRGIPGKGRALRFLAVHIQTNVASKFGGLGLVIHWSRSPAARRWQYNSKKSSRDISPAASVSVE